MSQTSQPSPIAAMIAADFTVRRKITDELRDAYHDTDYPQPTVADVIDDALTNVASDVETWAHDLANCNKIDPCTAEAVVLHHLAQLLGGTR